MFTGYFHTLAVQFHWTVSPSSSKVPFGGARGDLSGLCQGLGIQSYILARIPQIKPPFLDIAPAGIPPNIIPHSKSVKCGLMRPDSLKFPAFMGQPLYCQA